MTIMLQPRALRKNLRAINKFVADADYRLAFFHQIFTCKIGVASRLN